MFSHQNTLKHFKLCFYKQLMVNAEHVINIIKQVVNVIEQLINEPR